MTAEWLGHNNLCPVQWGKPCDCAAVVEVDLFAELDLMADEEDDE